MVKFCPGLGGSGFTEMDVISRGKPGKPRDNNTLYIEGIPTRIESQTAINVFPSCCCTDRSIVTHRSLLIHEDTGLASSQAEGHNTEEGDGTHS